MTETNVKKKCNCEFCVRSSQFQHNLSLIENQHAKKWFSDFYEYVLDVEEDLVCQKIYMNNLKNLYPKIWKEVHTISNLKKDDAQFPEKQI